MEVYPAMLAPNISAVIFCRLLVNFSKDDITIRATDFRKEKLMTADEYGKAYTSGFHNTVRLLASRGVPYDWAHDIAQIAWIKGWKKLYQLRKPKLLTTWVNRIAIMEYLVQLRERRNTVVHVAIPASLHSDPRRDLENSIAVNEIFSLAGAKDVDLLKAFYIDGFTTTELAAASPKKRSVVAIRIRMYRAKKTILKRLKKNQKFKGTH